MWATIACAASVAAAAAAQAKAQRDSMQVYRDIGLANMKDLLGAKCEYCHSNHRSNYCPSCGAPTKAQQQRNEGGQPERQRVSVVYGTQALRPDLAARVTHGWDSPGPAHLPYRSSAPEEDGRKRRDEEDGAARRHRNDTSYTPPVAAPDYSSCDTSSSSSSSDSYSGGGGSFDGGGASGDY